MVVSNGGFQITKYDMMHVYVYIDYIYMYCIHTIYRLTFIFIQLQHTHLWAGNRLLSKTPQRGEFQTFQNKKRCFWGLSENQPATTKEILMTVRFWTHGWDLFSPAQGLIFHLWERDYRRVYAEDMKEFPGFLRETRGSNKGRQSYKGGISMYVKMSCCVYPEIYCGRSFFFICISDSQRIESCHGTSEGIAFYRMQFPWCTRWGLSPKPQSWIFFISQPQPARVEFSSCGLRLVDVPPQNLEAWKRKNAFSTRQTHKPVVLQVKLCFVCE